jgi:hypothetical protein
MMNSYIEEVVIIYPIRKSVVSFAIKRLILGKFDSNNSINSIKTSQIYKQPGACMN